MPEFEEDPNMFKLEGFPVHEGTEGHKSALAFDMGSVMGMVDKGKEVASKVKNFFSTDEEGDDPKGTPNPDELSEKGY